MVEYLGIFLYFIIATLLAIVLLGVSFVLATRKPDPEKVSAYECGFDPFDDARSRFDVQFYLVAILFIIFDLEVTFLFPWAMLSTTSDSSQISIPNKQAKPALLKEKIIYITLIICFYYIVLTNRFR
jgi:NADH:ubiquinone oxidoreductase subunit 3 (subunit A)